MIHIHGQLHITIPHEKVVEFINQDPMGQLDKPITATIGGVELKLSIDGYRRTSGEDEAHLYLSEYEEPTFQLTQ